MIIETRAWADAQMLDNLTDFVYPNLHRIGWKPGVHKAPTGYQHPWLVVTAVGTGGVWSREEGRRAWRAMRQD